MAGGMTMLGIAGLLTMASLAMLSVSFATDNWLLYIVNRVALLESNPGANTTDRWYFSQYRGLFRTCYEPKELVGGLPGYVSYDNCEPEKGYALDNDPALPSDQYYRIRIHLMRAHWAFFVAGIAMLLFATISSAVSCYNLSARTIQTTSALAFMAAFFIAGGMAFFHGYDYLEKQKINLDRFRYQFFSATDPDLMAARWNSYFLYGYSYILGWVSMGTSALAAIMYLCSWSAVQANETGDGARLYNPGSDFSSIARNRAYDYMDRGKYPEDVIYTSYPVDPYGGADAVYDYGGYRY